MKLFKSRPLKVSLVISVCYALFGSLWIIYSGKLTAVAVGLGIDYFRGEMFKGLFFIFVTAVSLFFIISYYLHQLEKSRLKSNHRKIKLQNLIGNVPGMVYSCRPDKQRTLQFVSGNAEKLTGYKSDALIDNRQISFADLIHPDDKKVVLETLEKAVEEESGFTIEYRIIDASGRDKWVKERGNCVYDEANDLVTVEGVIESTADIKAAEKSAEAAQAEAEFMAHFDTLTGLPTRGYFLEKITRTIQEADDRAEKSQYAFCVIDITDFRQINDFYGYWVGNKVLQVCARWLRSRLPETAALGRLGGDEFGVFLDVSDKDDVRSYMEGLLEPYEHSLSTESGEITFEIHAGVAVYPRHGKTLETVFAAANRALSRAKTDKSQRRVVLYCPADREALEARMQSAEQVFEALAESRLEMHYQPIVDARTGAVLMQEALLRFNMADGDMKTMADYSDIVYEGRLTRQLDNWVIDRVLSETRKCLGSDYIPLVSINLCPTSVLEPEFFDKLNLKMEKRNFPRQKLVVEVTEQLIAAHSEVAVKHLVQAAKDHGYSFALDDFGVGHGSFQTLKNFPVDYLKIDGSFVLKLLENDVDQNFIQSISELCDELDIVVIAEWIEDEETAHKLRSLGVDYHQGYYYSWPKELSALAEIYGSSCNNS